MGITIGKKLKEKDRPLKLRGDYGADRGTWLQMTELQIHELNGVSFTEEKFSNWNFETSLKLEKGEVIS